MLKWVFTFTRNSTHELHSSTELRQAYFFSLSVFSIIFPSVPFTIRILVVFKCYIFAISISKCIYFEILSNSLLREFYQMGCSFPWNRIYDFTLLGVFTPTLADGFLLEFEWQQVSSSLFSVFWPISIMLSFGWSPLVFLFPSLPVLLSILWWLYQAHQLQLLSVLLQGLGTHLSFCFFSLLPSG